ncbi:hypothetical protein GCM10009582_34020 [Arthrobacter flavus]
MQRRQAGKFAERDAATAAERQRAFDQQFAAQPAQQAPQAPPPGYPPPPDPIQQLKDLATLKAQGILTEEEFAAQKARVLGG